MGRRGYPPEFRRKVLDLVEAGRPIAEVAKALGNERPVDLHLASPGPYRPGPVARSEQPREGGAGGRPPSDRAAGDRAGGHAPCRRAAHRASAPFRRFAAIQVMAEAKLPVQVCCRVQGGLGVRFLRLAQPATLDPGDLPCLADRCHPPGAHRLPADPRAAGGCRPSSPWVGASRSASTLSSCRLRRAGLPGVTGRPKYRRGLRPEATASDLVQRRRSGPDQLWVTDSTEHPTREGKLSCAVVLDACSRR
jgi:putative transposase